MNSTEIVPIELAHVEALANTIDVEAGTDLLTTPDELRGWLAGRGLLDAEQRVTADDLELARALRDALRDALLPHGIATAGPQPATALEAVAARLPLVVTADPAGAVGLRGYAGPGSAPVAAALATVLGGVVEAAARGTWDRLKVCPEDTCRWVFYDRSKNRSRRWCTMDVCGNRAKTRGYRARRRAPAAV